MQQYMLRGSRWKSLRVFRYMDGTRVYHLSGVLSKVETMVIADLLKVSKFP